ncbi:MAG: hypothetical protein ACK5IJ_01195 [Mangrovibacterium sp.]
MKRLLLIFCSAVLISLSLNTLHEKHQHVQNLQHANIENDSSMFDFLQICERNEQLAIVEIPSPIVPSVIKHIGNSFCHVNAVRLSTPSQFSSEYQLSSCPKAQSYLLKIIFPYHNFI